MVEYSSIMPTFTSSDSTSKNTLQGWQKQGAWGFFDETETGIQETNSLAITLCNTTANFTEIKQVLDYVSQMIEVELKIKEPSQIPVHFIDGRVGEITLKEKNIGVCRNASLRCG